MENLDSTLSEPESNRQIQKQIPNNKQLRATKAAKASGAQSHQRKQTKPKKKIINTQALQEIVHLQNNTGHVIPRLPFARLVREIMIDFCPDICRIQTEALAALQEASEMYLSHMMEDAYRCTLHRARQTLMPIDVQLVRLIRGISDLGN